MKPKQFHNGFGYWKTAWRDVERSLISTHILSTSIHHTFFTKARTVANFVYGINTTNIIYVKPCDSGFIYKQGFQYSGNVQSYYILPPILFLQCVLPKASIDAKVSTANTTNSKCFTYLPSSRHLQMVL